MNKPLIFKTADEAFRKLYTKIDSSGVVTAVGTKKLSNVGFYILNPQKNTISVPWRKWSLKYAERELNWYLSKNRSVEELKKHAPIWDRMHGGDNIVNSNYGFLWNENDQLQKTIDQLKKNPNSRQAWITLFDGKNKDQFEFDTPCTLNIGFTIEENQLCITVLMRSNDLWYGFCNDQYCFSFLQKYVSEALGISPGWYYHFAADLHIYEGQYGKNITSKQLKLDL